MAIDQMSLRPVAISRPPQPSTPWTTVPAAAAVIVSPAGDQGAGKKVKFLCSFGGRIIPRPSDGALRYVGGHTRIISVQKDASFAEFAAKMAEALGESSAVFKYQLPGEDLDALVSVSCSEDLVNMMEEYDKLAATVPDGSAKIRAFLFSPAELAAAAMDYPMRTGGGMESTGRMYFEAVNGVAAADGIDGLQRKESSGSASSSTQNLQGTIIGEATNGVVSECTVSGLLTNAIDSPHNATRFVYLDRNNAPAIPVAGMVSPESNISSLARQEGIPATHFAPAYIEPVRIQNMNPTQMGVAGGTQTVNLVPFTVHHYMPTGADNSVALHASQADNLNSAQPRLELKQEDPYGGKFSQQHPGDRNLKPLSQLPPLPPSSVQPPDADRYCLSEVSHIQQPQLLRMADCLMCQKALPHAHSDTLIQDYAISSIGNHTEVPPMFYSFRSQDIDKEQFCQFDAEVSGQDLSYQNSKNVVSRGQLADYMCHQINEAQKYTNGDPISQKVENLNRVDMQYLAAEASGGASFSNHMHCHLEDSSQFQQQKQQQLLQMFQHQNYPFEREIVDTPHPGHDLKERQQWQTLQPSQYVVKQGSVVNPADKSTVRNSDFAVVEPVALDYMNFPDHQYIRSFTDRVNMLHLSPLETSEYQGKPLGYPPGIPVSVKHDDSVLMVGNSYNGPSYKENTPFFGNAVVNPGFLPNVNYMMPNEQFPPTKHNVESLISNRGAAVMRSNGPFPSNLGIGTGTGYPVSYENSLRSPRVSCGIVSEVTSDRRNGASHIQSREILDRFSVPPNDNSPFQLSHAPGLSGCVKTFSEQLPSDSLFYDQDLHSNPDNTHVFPPRPNIVDDNDVVAPKNSCISNHIGVSIGSNVVSLLEEGNLQHPTEYLINDSKSEAVQLRKEEDHIKQQLQAVAEDVAASVLQPNVTGFASDTEEFASELNYKREIIEENDDSEKAAHDENSEDAKIRNLEKLHHGFQLTDDIGHLQIIKNCDLEELRELGSGAFGIVYHGKWRGTDVAIKRINERCFTGKQSEQERMRTDFWNEACKLAELHHPNVVAFYGIVLDGPEGSVATVTEYMANGSLRQVLLRNDRSLDCRKRLLIAMDVAFGMEYLHAKNIVHFDLKSDNLLVNLRDPQRPICKVSDLGLSKVKCKTLISGGMRGTLPWMAPELLCGNDSLVSEKVDVYSFGVVLWELLTGEEPYADLHYGAIIGGILSNSLRPPIPKSCDAEWGMLMEQCWSAEPSDRPSFTEIADRLRLMAAAQPHKGHGQSQK